MRQRTWSITPKIDSITAAQGCGCPSGTENDTLSARSPLRATRTPKSASVPAHTGSPNQLLYQLIQDPQISFCTSSYKNTQAGMLIWGARGEQWSGQSSSTCL